MHGAPSVNYPVGRSRLEVAFIAIVALAASAAYAGWFLLTRPAWEHAAGAAVLLAACVVWALRGARAAPMGAIRWDGSGWVVPGREAAGEVQVVLDGQALLLLRWRSPGQADAWFWLERRHEPARWSDLRRAVYSRAAPEPPRATYPAANP